MGDECIVNNVVVIAVNVANNVVANGSLGRGNGRKEGLCCQGWTQYNMRVISKERRRRMP